MDCLSKDQPSHTSPSQTLDREMIKHVGLKIYWDQTISIAKGAGYRTWKKHIKNNPLANCVLALWMNTCKMWDWLPGFSTCVCFNPSVQSISVTWVY